MQNAFCQMCNRWKIDIHSLFDLFIWLLFVILQVHYGLLGQFQITLKLPLGSLKVHTELLLLLQWALKLFLQKPEH